MEFQRQLDRLPVAVLLMPLLLPLIKADPSIPMTYCAKMNTAATPANDTIYQSDGLCHDFCAGNWALAIIQRDTCWCSNFIPDPSTQTSTNKCDISCHGYPADTCGGDGLFGYIALPNKPSGTSLLAATSSVKSSTTIQTTITHDSSSTSSSTSSSSSSTPTPTTPTMATVTLDGIVKTVTVTPTGLPNTSSSAELSPAQGGGLSTGAAVGIAVVVVVVVAAIIGVVACVFMRRRRGRRAEEDADVTQSRKASSPGMTGTTAAGQTSEKTFGTPPDGPSVVDGTGRNRRSHLMPVDPRMDAYHNGIYGRTENKSHESFNSLRDDHDYSRRVHQPGRVLRMTNPDPSD